MGAADRQWLLRGTVVSLALVVAVVAWVVTSDEDGGGALASKQESPPRIVSAGELVNAATLSGHPVYWAGKIPGTELELTESGDGSALIRYLDGGAEAGEQAGRYLTVGSYPLADPTRALEAFAEEPGAVTRHSRDGREVVTAAQNPNSVYFVSPDNTVQVEVYDPSPQHAMALARSGQVRPAG